MTEKIYLIQRIDLYEYSDRISFYSIEEFTKGLHDRIQSRERLQMSFHVQIHLVNQEAQRSHIIQTVITFPTCQASLAQWAVTGFAPNFFHSCCEETINYSDIDWEKSVSEYEKEKEDALTIPPSLRLTTPEELGFCSEKKAAQLETHIANHLMAINSQCAQIQELRERITILEEKSK